LNIGTGAFYRSALFPLRLLDSESQFAVRRSKRVMTRAAWAIRVILLGLVWIEPGRFMVGGDGSDDQAAQESWPGPGSCFRTGLFSSEGGTGAGLPRGKARGMANRCPPGFFGG